MSESSAHPEPYRSSPLSSLLTSPILWGGLLTFSFYAIIPELPSHRELFERYFCGHPVEYATTYLFFVGISILIFKTAQLISERAAIQSHSVFELETSHPDLSFGEQLQRLVNDIPRRLQGTIFVTRIREIAAYLKQKDSPSSLEDHLRYLADRASDKVHSSYALVRTVTWAVPILGFLGTVIGITIAIANISPDQLQNSLTTVISGLSVSFDTTALALALSLLLVFGAFVIEKLERQVLDDVEEFGIQEITCRIPSTREAVVSPWQAAESQAAEELLSRSRELIDYQTRIWQEGIESMRQSWVHSLIAQEKDLHRTLGETIKSSVRNHQETLEESRREFLEAFNSTSRQLSQSHNESRIQQAQLQQSLQQQIEKFLGEWRAEAERNTKSFDAHSRQALAEIVTELKVWQKQLQSGTETATEQIREIRKQSELLNRLIENEETLSTYQQRLSQNLESVTAGNKLEEVLHNLNAAIHLLTARSLPRAA